MNNKVIPDQKTVDDLEAKIYQAYYKQNPEGDARFDVWPQVIKAKKSGNPVKELNIVLEEYSN